MTSVSPTHTLLPSEHTPSVVDEQPGCQQETQRRRGCWQRPPITPAPPPRPYDWPAKVKGHLKVNTEQRDTRIRSLLTLTTNLLSSNCVTDTHQDPVKGRGGPTSLHVAQDGDPGVKTQAAYYQLDMDEERRGVITNIERIKCSM